MFCITAWVQEAFRSKLRINQLNQFMLKKNLTSKTFNKKRFWYGRSYDCFMLHHFT